MEQTHPQHSRLCHVVVSLTGLACPCAAESVAAQPMGGACSKDVDEQVRSNPSNKSDSAMVSKRAASYSSLARNEGGVGGGGTADGAVPASAIAIPHTATGGSSDEAINDSSPEPSAALELDEDVIADLKSAHLKTIRAAL